ncbi:MAG: adaptor protein MecA [Candidatus Choladocola sp.]|nr:adaptor protein MecA [Candidatus Choladocola sp.]
MRIEKISDKQIRCTLTQTDLQNHHINIGELAYGSEKARSLFQEMLTQASKEFNFHAENIPLMIEAVPLSGDSLVLVITKVEDPDEIDTRFSRFSPSIDDEDFTGDFADIEAAFGDTKADEIIEEFNRLCEQQLQITDPKQLDDPAFSNEPDFFRIYAFASIDEVCRASRALQDAYDADNSLYKDPQHNRYYLALHKGTHSPQTFNKICNILSEYAENIHSNAGSEAYYQEHFSLILAGHALQSLKRL